MKEFLQSILKSAEDRIKNPFVGTFITSWIIFNWKPIIFIIFSNRSIEGKINFIKDNYSDIWSYLWLPLISAIFYIAILPYISFVFEYLTKFSHGLRNKVNLEARNATLKLQIGVAQNEIKLEEEKTTFRERNSHNLMVEGLLKQNKSLGEVLEEANKTHIETIQELQRQSENSAKELRDIIAYHKDELSTSNDVVRDQNSKIVDLRAELKQIKTENKENFNIASKLRHKLNVREFINFRFKNPVDKVITVDNYSIFEHFNVINEIVYFGIVDGKRLSHEYVYNLLHDKSYGELSDFAGVEAYREELLKLLSEDHKAELNRN